MWKTLDSKVVVSARPWLRLTKDTVELPDGRVIDDYYQLSIPDFVVIVARDTDDRIVALRQYKYGLGRESLTLPGGQVERGETLLETAKRELREETGYVATNWQSLGSFVVNGNLGAGCGHFFRANNAVPDIEPNSGDLEDTTVELLDACQLLAALTDGDVGLLNHAAAIALATLADAGPHQA